MSDGDEKDQQAEPQPDAERLTFEEHMDKLHANPRFKVIEPTGQSFIIGGQSPKPPKPQS
jgi:hypothetical protein